MIHPLRVAAGCALSRVGSGVSQPLESSAGEYGARSTAGTLTNLLPPAPHRAQNTSDDTTPRASLPATHGSPTTHAAAAAPRSEPSPAAAGRHEEALLLELEERCSKAELAVALVRLDRLFQAEQAARQRVRRCSSPVASSTSRARWDCD